VVGFASCGPDAAAFASTVFANTVFAPVKCDAGAASSGNRARSGSASHNPGSNATTTGTRWAVA
jgi:hypothetical protein